MYDPNGEWTAKTVAGAREPVYYIAIEGLTTKHFSTGPVRAASVSKSELLKVPSSTGQKISQLQGSSSFTLFDVELLDKAGEITDLVSTEKVGPLVTSLINRNVTLWSGYADLNEDKYAPIAIGQISAVKLGAGGLTYTFSLVDVRRWARETIMDNANASGSRLETTLTGNVAVGAKKVFVTDAVDLSEGDFFYLGPSSNGSYLGQEERHKVRSVNKSSIPNSIVIEQGEQMAIALNAGDEVRWASSLVRGNPYNILHCLLTGDFDDASFPLEKVRGEPTGLGIPAGEIDSAGIAAERDDMMAGGEIWSFEFTKPEKGLRFVEQALCRVLGYLRITGGGKLAFRSYRPVRSDVAAAGLPTIMQEDIQEIVWESAHDLHVNRVVIGLDYDAAENEANREIVTEDTADQVTTKEAPEIESEDSGLMEDQRGVRLAEERGAVVLRRLLLPPYICRVRTGLHKRAIEVGDVPMLTHPSVPDNFAGTRGIISRRMEVTERQENFKAGNMWLTLEDPRFTRPAWIAPDAAPDYGSATAADKEWAYIAPDSGDFADAGKPYEII